MGPPPETALSVQRSTDESGEWNGSAHAGPFCFSAWVFDGVTDRARCATDGLCESRGGGRGAAQKGRHASRVRGSCPHVACSRLHRPNDRARGSDAGDGREEDVAGEPQPRARSAVRHRQLRLDAAGARLARGPVPRTDRAARRARRAAPGSAHRRRHLRHGHRPRQHRRCALQPERRRRRSDERRVVSGARRRSLPQRRGRPVG